MKRIFAVALALMLLLALNAGAAGGAAENDYNIQALQRIGIIKGYRDGSLRADALISREEFAAIIYRFATGNLASAPSFSGKAVFKDVSPKDWSYGYIYYCYNYQPKLLAGYPDGTFRPKNNITLAEAIKVFVQMIYKGNELVFPYGYIAKANELGLLRGMEQNIDWVQPASRASVSLLAVNALTCTAASAEAQVDKLLKNLGIGVIKAKIAGVKGNLAENFTIDKGFIAEISNGYGKQTLAADLSMSLDGLLGYGVWLFFSDDNKNKTLDIISSLVPTGGDSFYRIYTPTEGIVAAVMAENRLLQGKLSEIKMFVSGTDGSFFFASKEYFYSRDALYIINGKIIDKGTRGESRFEMLYGSPQGEFTMVDTDGDTLYDTCIIRTAS